MPDDQKDKSFTIDCHDVVQHVEFSPFEWSNNLLAIGTSARIVVGKVTLPNRQQENVEVDEDGVMFENVRTFHHGTRVTAIAWSPETSLQIVPQVLCLCSAGADKKLRLFTSDLKTEDNVKFLEGHRDYINCISFDPEKGEHLASVSDDNTCRLWGTDGEQKACLSLGGPGMSVCWHTEEPMKIMVAEKSGTIRFYNLLNQQPIMSLSCGYGPVLFADWCHGNPLHVAAASGSDWFVFDSSRSSGPLDSQQAHLDGTKCVKWSRSHSHMLATIGRPGSQIKIYNTKSNQVSLTADLTVLNGLTWHHRIPLVAVGGDKKVHFWHVDVM